VDSPEHLGIDPGRVLSERICDLDMRLFNFAHPGAGALFPIAGSLLLWACGWRTGGDSLPSGISRFPQDLNRADLEAVGIYEDGWVSKRAVVNLEQPTGEQVLAVRGVVPKIADAGFRTEIEVRVDDRGLVRRSVGPGDFRISAPVERGREKRRVTIVFSETQQLPGNDGRDVGAQIQFLGFESVDAAESQGSTDIVRGADIELRSGWGVLETFRKESFRWVENDAQVVIRASEPGDAALALVVEPGPGIEGRPFVLKVLDGSGRQVDAAKVNRRGRVELSLPVQAGDNEFRLHIEGGGKRIADDPRVLNFRVFRIETEPGGTGA
jgi:hypothetical protein